MSLESGDWTERDFYLALEIEISPIDEEHEEGFLHSREKVLRPRVDYGLVGYQ